MAVAHGTCYGQTDVDTAETFEEEAVVTKSRIDGITFDKVFTSPLSRAAKLAAFCGYPDAIRDDRLKEMNMGEWEMRRYEEIDDPHLQAWYQDFLHLPTTGGEGFPQLYQRVVSFLDELRKQPYERVAVFAHGGVLICAGIYGGLFTAEEAYDHLTGYGGMEVIEI